MSSIDRNRIVKFLIGEESIPDFESWIYSDTHLESRIGTAFYFDLLAASYTSKDVIDDLKKVILNKHMSDSDFKYWNYLNDSGWFYGRTIKLCKEDYPAVPEVQNAVKILDEFGGLTIVDPRSKENAPITFVEFSDSPGRIQSTSDYGLSNDLILIATTNNDYVNLFVDESNKFYQLDQIVSQDLYKYEGEGFESMMKELLQLEKEEKFEIVGRRK